jgi:predicted RNA-binding protein with PIN domain
VEYHERKGHDITVVFDGWKTGGAQENHSIVGGVRVIYSRLGEKADSVIRRMIFSDRRGWIVVTSDRDIAAHAWAAGAVPISSEDFMTVLEKRYVDQVTCEKREEEQEEEYVRPARKGNPKQLSKKEKAIRKTLSKLS